MRALFKTVLAQNRLSVLLAYNVAGCLLIFILLELWRPCFFLTDDNLTFSYPILTEIGRHLKQGEWPFVSNYLFGGHYDWSRDVSCLYWHPFFLLPTLLADTWAKAWIMDAIAFPYLLMTTVGFTILTYQLRNEFKLTLCDAWLIFYTMSFVFSMYVLIVTPSWLCFLGNESALPWLTLGILDRKISRGVMIITVVTIHQFVSSYAGMTVSNSLYLTLFALGLTLCRRTPAALFIWCAGNLLAYLLLAPFLLHVLDGVTHAVRLQGLTVESSSAFSVHAIVFPFSFFFGNWTELLANWVGDPSLDVLKFPYLCNLLPCAASLCLLSAFFGSWKWRPIELLCLTIASIIMVMIIRPPAIADAIQHIPLLKSMRWPFREILQFLFFIHLFIILRPQPRNELARRLTVIYSLVFFLGPLPFIRVPTFNALTLDRAAMFSGDGERYWAQVKLLLKPTDQIATVIDWNTWIKGKPLPGTYLGTANFPALYQVHSISGYSTTSPLDQLPLKTRPKFWFGPFDPTQVAAILQERPQLKLIVLESATPLRISLCAQGQPTIDLTPYLPHPDNRSEHPTAPTSNP